MRIDIDKLNQALPKGKVLEKLLKYKIDSFKDDFETVIIVLNIKGEILYLIDSFEVLELYNNKNKLLQNYEYCYNDDLDAEQIEEKEKNIKELKEFLRRL